jgi:hypothetical protein
MVNPARNIAIALVFACCPLLAQEAPRLQVFGGYSFESLRGPDNSFSGYHGWNASAAVRAYGKLSVVADAGGHYGQEMGTVNNSVRTFLFGPQVNLWRGRISPFVHALFGVTQLRADSGGPVYTDSTFTLAAGGGADLKITRRLSVRLVQADYLRRRFFEQSPDHFRVSGGVVLRLGR